MPPHFSYDFKTPTYNGKISMSTGLYIGGEYVDGIDGKTHECVFFLSLLLVSNEELML